MSPPTLCDAAVEGSDGERPLGGRARRVELSHGRLFRKAFDMF